MGTVLNNRALLPTRPRMRTLPPLHDPPQPHEAAREEPLEAVVAMMTPRQAEAREVVGTTVGAGVIIVVTTGGAVTTVTVASATTGIIAAAPPLLWHLSSSMTTLSSWSG